MNENELAELDLWIAEHVMGWEWWRSSVTQRRCIFAPGSIPRCTSEWFTVRADKTETLVFDFPPNDLPKPTTNPADAFEVLKKCAEKSESSECLYVGVIDREWIVGLECDGGNKYEAVGITLELTICLFAKRLFEKP